MPAFEDGPHFPHPHVRVQVRLSINLFLEGADVFVLPRNGPEEPGLLQFPIRV